MSPTRKSKTRSSTTTNPKYTRSTTMSNSSTIEYTDDNLYGKVIGTKRMLIEDKELINEKGADIQSDEMIFNSSVGESTYSMLQPVAMNISSNFDAPPSSPPVLLIDTTEEVMKSQVPKPSRDTQSRTNDISRTPLAKKKKKSLSNNVENSYSTKDLSNNTNEEDISTNVATNFNRTPITGRSRPSTFAQIQDDGIIVSVDKFSQNSNGVNPCSYRTSTPFHSSRLEPIDNTFRESYNDSFCIDSISPDVHEMLSRFPEFRKLVKAYRNEKQKSDVWINDYARLKRKYEQLEENSFPRPSANALDYLLDLVTRIQQTGGRNDPRTDEQLARDIGINPIVLSSFKDSTPQQTALKIFNHIYFGYSAKIQLGSVNNMERLKPGLLDSILVYAQRAVPGVRYKIQELRDALNNSIRSARYQSKKPRGIAIKMFNGNSAGGSLQPNIDLSINDENILGNNHLEFDEL